MCGIAGILVQEHAFSKERLLDELSKLTNSIRHRGPDGFGHWEDGSGMALGHRRLSILDLSESGRQPMISQSERYVITFNGEIYNHAELRKRLEVEDQLLLDKRRGSIWNGASDTETLLAAIQRWGVRGAVEKCVGMFAFGVWDKHERELYLVRDRIGEKPLYYTWQGTGILEKFLFASDLKAFECNPDFSGTVDPNSLGMLIRYGYIPNPNSIYEGVKKLAPGHILRVSLRRREPQLETYWCLRNVASRASSSPFQGTIDDAARELESLLAKSVSAQIVADVPVGAFLSGGVDSSTVVATMCAVSHTAVKTFTIGFNSENNEANFAAEVAKYFGTSHTELYVSDSDLIDVIQNLPNVFSEPFADASQIPTVLVSRLARRSVTVALSGDGGDELLGGYARYRRAIGVEKIARLVPRCFAANANRLANAIDPERWSAIQSFLPRSVNRKLNGRLLADLAINASRIMMGNFDSRYLEFLSNGEPNALFAKGNTWVDIVQQRLGHLYGFDEKSRMMLLDSLTYLPDDILVKIDRSAMSVGLECRCPMLDHRIVEFTQSLPMSFKLGAADGKMVLKSVLGRSLPQSLWDRPKRGFSVPLNEWLRGPLRDWAGDLLSESMINKTNLFDYAQVSKLWLQHLRGIRNNRNVLWPLLMFQSWFHQKREIQL